MDLIMYISSDTNIENNAALVFEPENPADSFSRIVN